MAKTAKVTDTAKAATGKVKAKADKPAKADATKVEPKKAKSPASSSASKDQAKGAAGVVKGKVQKTVGKATGDKKLQAKGKATETGAKGLGKVAKGRKKLSK